MAEPEKVVRTYVEFNADELERVPDNSYRCAKLLVECEAGEQLKEEIEAAQKI